MLAFGKDAQRGVDLGTRASLSDIGQTVAENFSTRIPRGVSFLKELRAPN
jgi:phosphopentomutase